MAKKFKFKLAPVLKLRHFKEESIKLELGKHVSELNVIKDKLEELEHNIDMGYQEVERLKANSITAGHLKFYPMYFEGIRADIKKHQKMLLDKEKEYKACLNKLAVAMGEVKVLEKLKDKETHQFKKEIEKKQNAENEERFLGQRYYHIINAREEELP